MLESAKKRPLVAISLALFVSPATTYVRAQAIDRDAIPAQIEFSEKAHIPGRGVTLLVSTERSLSGGLYVELGGDCRGLVALHAVREAKHITVMLGDRKSPATVEWPAKSITDEQKLDDLVVVRLRDRIGDCLPFDQIVEDHLLRGRGDAHTWIAETYGYDGVVHAAPIRRRFTGERHLRAGIYYWRFPEPFRRGSSGAPLFVDGNMIGIVWGYDVKEHIGYAMTNTTIRSRLREFLTNMNAQ